MQLLIARKRNLSFSPVTLRDSNGRAIRFQGRLSSSNPEFEEAVQHALGAGKQVIRPDGDVDLPRVSKRLPSNMRCVSLTVQSLPGSMYVVDTLSLC